MIRTFPPLHPLSMQFHISNRSVSESCRKICSGIHPVITQRSVPELLPGKSYPPRTLRYAFSIRAGHNSCGFLRSTTCSTRLVRETGSRSSITTLRQQPLKFNLMMYFPLGDRAGFFASLSHGYISSPRSFGYPLMLEQCKRTCLQRQSSPLLHPGRDPSWGLLSPMMVQTLIYPLQTR